MSLVSGSIHKALHDLTTLLQIIIFQREDTPIKDRAEAIEALSLRIRNIANIGTGENGKSEWRTALLELAAHAIWAAVSDE